MANYDEKTGIAYGVISPHAINQDVLEDLYNDGTDPHYENARQEIITAVSDFAGNSGLVISDEMQMQISDLLIDDISDHYQGNDGGQCDYSDKDYTLHVSGDNFGIFVIKSPYYTYCRKCSPCAPGAGDLNNPLEIDGIEVLDTYDRALCLDSSFFDDGKAPYRVFRVEDDQEVL